MGIVVNFENVDIFDIFENFENFDMNFVLGKPGSVLVPSVYGFHSTDGV
jgi:hypothetical protein